MAKILNDYALQLGRVLELCPKAVLAAIAVSALTAGGDYLPFAKEVIVSEWNVLAENDIVEQPVPASLRQYILEYDALDQKISDLLKG